MDTANFLTMRVPMTSDPQVNQQLAARHKFGIEYARSKGWNIEAVTIQQVLEIRDQPGWKDPVAAQATVETADHLWLGDSPPRVVEERVYALDKQKVQDETGKETVVDVPREILRRGGGG